MVDLIPSWSEVAASYPYAPGSQDMSKEEWKKLRLADKETRKAARQAEAEDRKLKLYDKKWNEMADDSLALDRAEQPDRTPWYDFASRIGKPQTGVDVALATGAGFARPFTWLGEMAGKLITGEDDKQKPDMKNWMEQYLAGAGGQSASGADLAAMGSAAPNIQGYIPNWKELEQELKGIEEPDYVEEAFDPMNTVANMLMNADWVNSDMSRAGKVMQDAFNRKAKGNADTANANKQAKIEQQRWTAMKKLALEEMKSQSALQQANIAMQNWQAQQPRALGGNKMAWRDAAGNLHFEQLDKQGEARNVGSNAAMIEMAAAGGKMTPKKILQKAQAAAMLYPDANKVPFINGYMQQAMMMLPQEE